MSAEFITSTFPCTDCLVRPACKIHNEQITRASFYEHISSTSRFLMVPSDPARKNQYRKIVTECWANFACDLVDTIRGDKDIDHVPGAYIDFFIEMFGLMQWIVNSKSWQDGEELYDFDKSEVLKKLDRAKLWIKNATVAQSGQSC